MSMKDEKKKKSRTKLTLNKWSDTHKWTCTFIQTHKRRHLIKNVSGIKKKKYCHWKIKHNNAGIKKKNSTILSSRPCNLYTTCTFAVIFSVLTAKIRKPSRHLFTKFFTQVKSLEEGQAYFFFPEKITNYCFRINIKNKNKQHKLCTSTAGIKIITHILS